MCVVAVDLLQVLVRDVGAERATAGVELPTVPLFDPLIAFVSTQ